MGKYPKKIKGRNEEISTFFCWKNLEKLDFTGISHFEFRARWERNEEKMLILTNHIC